MAPSNAARKPAKEAALEDQAGPLFDGEDGAGRGAQDALGGAASNRLHHARSPGDRHDNQIAGIRLRELQDLGDSVAFRLADRLPTHPRPLGQSHPRGFVRKMEHGWEALESRCASTAARSDRGDANGTRIRRRELRPSSTSMNPGTRSGTKRACMPVFRASRSATERRAQRGRPLLPSVESTNRSAGSRSRYSNDACRGSLLRAPIF